MKRAFSKQILTAGLLVLLGLAGVRAVMAHPGIARPVGRFIHFYQATENTTVPISIWQRLVYSLVLSNHIDPQS